MGPIEQKIREKLIQALDPSHLAVINDSHGHNVPKNSETHFRVIAVSEKFKGVSRVARQRLVTDLLKEEMGRGGIHALQQKLMSPAEFENDPEAQLTAPACRGGSKREL